MQNFAIDERFSLPDHQVTLQGITLAYYGQLEWLPIREEQKKDIIFRTLMTD